jgi:hypothetical protein
MENSSQVKGLISYLTKLIHTVDAFRVSFGNIEVGKTTRNMQSYVQIKYDLNITPKEPNSPYLWDFFNCKSKHIIQDGCEMVSLNWADVFTEVKDIYYNGRLISKYGGNIPNSFIEKITKDIEQSSPKQINTHFFCGGSKKTLTLNVKYEVSDIYIDDGITTDVSVYCSQALVDGEPLDNIPKNLVETIVGYVSEDDNLRTPSDNIVWDEITKYMNLGDCELWTHTYTFIRSIGDIEVTDFNYTNHSTFSSKMCDFISGDY